LLLAAAGVFLWQKYKKPYIPYVLSEEFTITESNGEKIIEYKKTGFKMRTPGDWEIDGFIARNGLLLTSPDFEFYEKVGPYSPPIPEKGCSVTISIIKRSSLDMEYNPIGELIEVCPEVGQECNDYIIVEFNGFRGLEHTYIPENSLIPGKYVSIEIPKGDKIYSFETHLFSQDRERCEQEFDKILNTIEIRK
jgi:hypothetical protein